LNLEALVDCLVEIGVLSIPKCPLVPMENARRTSSIIESSPIDYGKSSTAEHQELFRIFVENVQPVTSFIEAELFELIENHGSELVMNAIKEAIDYNKRNIAYIRKVLVSWDVAGGKTQPLKNSGFYSKAFRSKTETTGNRR
jgi:DnaD/phage-associated family protein